jgi:hypothetical protein
VVVGIDAEASGITNKESLSRRASQQRCDRFLWHGHAVATGDQFLNFDNGEMQRGDICHGVDYERLEDPYLILTLVKTRFDVCDCNQAAGPDSW